MVLFCDGYYDDCCRSRQRTSSINGQKMSVLIVMEGMCVMWDVPQDTRPATSVFTCYYCVLEIINLFVVINFGAFSCFIYFYCMLSISLCELWAWLLVLWFQELKSLIHFTIRNFVNGIRRFSFQESKL